MLIRHNLSDSRASRHKSLSCILTLDHSFKYLLVSSFLFFNDAFLLQEEMFDCSVQVKFFLLLLKIINIIEE